MYKPLRMNTKEINEFPKNKQTIVFITSNNVCLAAYFTVVRK